MKKKNIGIILIVAISFALMLLKISSQAHNIIVPENMPGSTLSVGYNVFAVDTSGKLWGWGENIYNVLRTEDSVVLYPREVFDSVKSVSAGSSFVLAIRQDDSLWGWGWNRYGTLGLGTNTELEDIPVKIMDDVAAVSAGSAKSVVLKKRAGSFRVVVWVSLDNELATLETKAAFEF